MGTDNLGRDVWRAHGRRRQRAGRPPFGDALALVLGTTVGLVLGLSTRGVTDDIIMSWSTCFCRCLS